MAFEEAEDRADTKAYWDRQIRSLQMSYDVRLNGATMLNTDSEFDAQNETTGTSGVWL